MFSMDLPRPRQLLLIAPVVDVRKTATWRSQTTPTEPDELSPITLSSSVDCTFGVLHDFDDPLINPYLTNPTNLSSIDILAVAFYNDILYTDNIYLYQYWKSVGLPVEIRVYPGPHHMLRLDKISPAAKRMRTDGVEFIKRGQESLMWSITQLARQRARNVLQILEIALRTPNQVAQSLPTIPEQPLTHTDIWFAKFKHREVMILAALRTPFSMKNNFDPAILGCIYGVVDPSVYFDVVCTEMVAHGMTPPSQNEVGAVFVSR